MNFQKKKKNVKFDIGYVKIDFMKTYILYSDQKKKKNYKYSPVPF